MADDNFNATLRRHYFKHSIHPTVEIPSLFREEEQPEQPVK